MIQEYGVARFISDDDLEVLERQHNSRPCKRHGGLTPEDVFFRMTGVALYF